MNNYKVSLEMEMLQWTGDNYKEICDFIGDELERDASELFNGEPSNLIVPTPNGIREVRILDVVMKDNFGNIYVFNN